MDMRTEALKLGQDYLQKLGFNGFSFQTIADSLGIKKPSLHYYFATKQDLGLALIEEYQKQYESWTHKVHLLPANVKIHKLLKIFDRIIEDESKICPLGALCADFNSLSKPVQKKLLQFHEVQRQWLKETIIQGQREKTFRKDLDVDSIVDLWMTSIQGGMQVARLRGDARHFKNLGQTLIRCVEI